MNSILVTGASRGIGRQIAEHLCSNGYHVIGVGRKKPSDNTVFEFYEIDLSQIESEKSLVELSKTHTFSALINCAGVLHSGLLLRLPSSKITEMLNINLRGTILTSKILFRNLSKSGGGRIINFSSIAASVALEGDAVYSCTKAAIECFTKALAKEYARKSITVNCIAPGILDTDMTKNISDILKQDLVNRQIVRTKASFDDINDVVDFLLSEKSKMISGAVFNIGGV